MKWLVPRLLSALGFEVGRGRPLSSEADPIAGQLTIVLLLRTLILAGAGVRFLLHRGDYAEPGAWLAVQLALGGFAVYVFALVALRQLARRAFFSEASQLTQIVADSGFATLLYDLTGEIQSDFFLFYVLPILLISSRHWRLKSALALGLPATGMLALVALMPAGSGEGAAASLTASLLRVYAPRMVLLGSFWALVNVVVMYRLEIEREHRDNETLRGLLSQARRQASAESERAQEAEKERVAAAAAAIAASEAYELEPLYAGCASPGRERLSAARASAAPSHARPAPTAEPARAAAPGDLSDRFELLKPLHRRLEETYLAYDRQRDEVVAVRLLSRTGLDGQALAALRDFVSALRQVSHPNVARVRDLVTSPVASFLTFENFTGVPLRSLLDSQHAFPLGPGLQIARKLIDGAAALHAAGLLHGELSPDSLFLLPSGELKVIVFGRAQMAAATGTGLALSAHTLAYASPEQRAGQPFDQRVDVYALGLILYELFTGVHPFAAENGPEPASRRRPEQAAPLSGYRSDLPRALERLVLACLAALPIRRPRSAEELRAALDKL